MPRGTILVARPIGLDNEYDWIEDLVKFIKDNYGLDLAIGVIDICEDGTDVKTGEKLLFIIPETELPDGFKDGSCNEEEAKEVSFKIKKEPFKYAYDVKKMY